MNPSSPADLLGDPARPKIARVWDCETTGFADQPETETIELGRIDVCLETRTVSNPWRGFIRPKGEIPPEAMAVHHITLAEIDAEGEAERPWGQLWQDCGPNDVVVAHNAAFEKDIHSANGRPWICTYKCARVVWPNAPGHSNQVLRYWLGLDQKPGFNPALAMPPHRALPDAYVTAFLLVELLQHRSVEEMVHITKYPALLTKLTFGKHKGARFDEAPRDYLEWLRDKSEMDADVKFSARYWLAKG